MRTAVAVAVKKTVASIILLAVVFGLLSFSALGIDAPSGLSAAATGTSAAGLTWNAADGAVNYNIFRSTAPDSGFSQIGSTGATNYFDGGLSSATTYYYKITSVDNMSQVSGESAVVSASTHATVTFDLMGGAMDSPATSVVSYGSAVGTPSYPYRTKYRFAGWSTDAAGNAPYNFSSGVRSNMTLYAKWTPEYTVTYYRNQDGADGVSVLGDFYLLYDRVDLSPITAVGHTKTNWYRAGYTFAGWSKTRDGKLLETPIYVIGSDISLFAQYRENSYTVSFDLNGGTGDAPSQTLKYEDKIARPDEPTQKGYTFSGWYYGEEKWDFSTDTLPDGSITLKAVWEEEIPHIVTLDFGDGRKAVQLQARQNELVARPEDPVRAGYVFKGWNYNGKAWNFETDKMPSKNITLKASWESDPDVTLPPENPADDGASGSGFGSFSDRIAMQTGNLFSDIAKGNVPLGGFGYKGYFSALSLLMALASVVLSIVLTVRIFAKKKKLRGFLRHMTSLIGLFAVIVGVLTAASFFLQQDFGAPMLFISETTLLTGLLFLVHLTFVVIYFRKGFRRNEWADYSKEAAAMSKAVHYR